MREISYLFELERLFASAYAKAKEMLKPYPEREEDLQYALSIVKSGLTPLDAALLFQTQDLLCEKCGECCRRNTPINIHRNELKWIAIYLGTSYKALKKKLKLVPKGDGTFDLHGRPCKFLKDNRCTIYPVRPLVCQGFPASALAIQFSQGRQGIELPSYCKAIRNMLTVKMASIAITRAFQREHPETARQVEEESRRVVDQFFAGAHTPQEQMLSAMRLAQWMLLSRSFKSREATSKI